MYFGKNNFWVKIDKTIKNSFSLKKSWVCDGVADCKRGEDELDCEVHCEIGQFSCPIHKNSTVPK